MYVAPVTFESVKLALEYIQGELQSKVDAHNASVLTLEQYTDKIELLENQYATLKAKSEDLLADNARIEAKLHQAKQELKDYTEKTTKRLEKERSDFEEVRVKRRTELESKEKELNDRSQGLDQRESGLTARETDIERREAVATDVESSFSDVQSKLEVREHEIEAKIADHTKKVAEDTTSIEKMRTEVEESIATQEAALQVKQETTESSLREIEGYKERAAKFMLLAEEKLKSVEKVAEGQKGREERLNLRQANLIAMDKVLSTRKIQLDDREAVIKSY